MINTHILKGEGITSSFVRHEALLLHCTGRKPKKNAKFMAKTAYATTDASNISQLPREGKCRRHQHPARHTFSSTKALLVILRCMKGEWRRASNCDPHCICDHLLSHWLENVVFTLRQQNQPLTPLRRPAKHRKSNARRPNERAPAFSVQYHSTGIDTRQQQRVHSPVRSFPSRYTLCNAANFPSSLGIDPVRPIRTCSTVQELFPGSPCSLGALVTIARHCLPYQQHVHRHAYQRLVEGAANNRLIGTYCRLCKIPTIIRFMFGVPRVERRGASSVWYSS